jgi:hypothetical protein
VEGKAFGRLLEAPGGLAEEAERQVQVVEVGFVAGLDVLDEATEHELVMVRFSPETNDEAFTPVGATRHGTILSDE